MVCLTDLPIRTEGRTVVAEVALGEPISLVSLPALGAVSIDRRVRAAVADLGWAMHRRFDPEDDAGEFGPPSLHQSRHIETAVLDDGPIDFRYTSSRICPRAESQMRLSCDNTAPVVGRQSHTPHSRADSFAVPSRAIALDVTSSPAGLASAPGFHAGRARSAGAEHEPMTPVTD
jgi:hypothetical protein